MIRRITFLLVFFAALFSATQNAHAFAGAWQGDDSASVRLISGVDGVGQDTHIPLGVEIKLGSEWHTYWRSPGEAGLPPQFSWNTEEAGNLKAATLSYPAPKRYSAFNLETIGYREHMVLPIDAELRVPGKPLTAEGTLDLLICSQICVPKHFVLKIIVPDQPATPGVEAGLLKEFQNKVPGDANTSGISITNIANDGDNLLIDITARDELQAPDIFIESEKDQPFAAPIAAVQADKHQAQFKITPAPVQVSGAATLAGAHLTLTIVDGDHALEQKITVPAASGHNLPASTPASGQTNTSTKPKADLPPPSTPALPFAVIILFAIIGGFILNLMPCVLPVLSLKLVSVISHGGGEKRLVRSSFLVTAAGILFSFMVLAAGTIVLKEAGLAVGWGVQFQQPVFLGLLVLLLTFFAGNMWGLYEIRMPQFLADSFNGPYHPKLAGDFATGAFATILATPCTAPFLGTAVGFALASGPQEILIIFAALGFGMTLPYLAVAVWPRIATALPRPGIWMMHLRHLLAWALAITAVWLIWVLAAQISERGAIVVGLCMLAILGLFALKRQGPRSYLSFGIAGFALLAFGTTLAGSLAPKPKVPIDSVWQPFDESKLAHDIETGKTVFVDVTADWCLTCKANKKFILARDEITHRLFHTDVIPMQADWTNPDANIAAFLQKYGRYGIPFNIIYGPGAPQGIVLPELLTPHKVLDALDQAEKSSQP